MYDFKKLSAQKPGRSNMTGAIGDFNNRGGRSFGRALAVLVFTLMVAGTLTAGGGPDAYGYTWLQTGDPGVPAFSWIDITGVGTEVVGLADDNSVGPINMGMTFHYYWGDYNEITIGSNGWLSFDSVANVAHCFPVIPTAGGAGDNLVAPFMADLQPAGAGSPAKVYYYSDLANDRFIVSFHEVPFWENSAQGWVGSNTFQVVFSTADNSIVFQYLDMDPSFNDTPGCAQDVSGGIENLTGNIGLQVFVESIPADSQVVAFTYPDPVTFVVIDPAPLWHNNFNDKGVFRAANQDVPLASGVWNAGNTDTSVAVNVQGQIIDLALAVFSDESVVVPSLAAQEAAFVYFTSVAPPPVGEYYFTTTTTSPEDINPSNNQLSSEIQVVDTTQPVLDLGYTAVVTPDGALAWGGGDGGGAVYILPPVADYQVDSVTMFIGDDLTNPTSDYQVQIIDDNGPGFSPGTVLASQTMAAGTFTPGNWVETTFDIPVGFHRSGFFVAWIALGENIYLGSDSSGPISRQTWEIIGAGPWAEYRLASFSDFLIRAQVTQTAPPAGLIFFDGFELGSIGAWSDSNP